MNLLFQEQLSTTKQNGEKVEVFYGDLWAHMDLQFQEQLSTSRIRRERSGGVSDTGILCCLWPQAHESSVSGTALYNNNQTGKK